MRAGFMNPITIGLSSSVRASATNWSRSAGSRSTCSVHGSRPISRHDGTHVNGWKVCRPSSNDTVRPCTCGVIGAPSAAASDENESSLRHASGSLLFWLSAYVTGRPVAAASRISQKELGEMIDAFPIHDRDNPVKRRRLDACDLHSG